MLNTSLNIRTARVAPLYMVPQKITTPKAHIIVAIRVAYGMRVRHVSQPPVKHKTDELSMEQKINEATPRSSCSDSKYDCNEYKLSCDLDISLSKDVSCKRLVGILL